MRDTVSELVDFNKGRDPERLALKYERMAASPFAFLRGSCHLFYRGLPRAAITKGVPLVWACGDLHLENLGSYRGDNGQVYFDINDFDEAVRAPASWDPLRLLTSVLVARPLFRATRKEAQELCQELLGAYADALHDGKARWVERETATPPIRGLIAQADASHHAELLASRTKRGRIRIDGERALVAADEDQQKVRSLFQVLRKKLPPFAQNKVLDVARRIAGTGSLGLERYVILMEAKGDAERQHLLDLKVAVSPAALRYGPRLTQPSFRDDADRTVSVQRRMQAIAMASLHAVRMGGKPFVLRRLLPSEDRIDLAKLKQSRVPNLLRSAGECLAWDQLRSGGRDGSATADALIAHGAQRAWRRPLLALAIETASQVERDYEQFMRARERGQL